MKDEGIIRALAFWRRLIGLPDENLAKKAYLVQKGWADRGLKCWALDTKKELEKLGQSGWWDNQNRLLVRAGKFRSVIRQIITGQRIVSQREEGKNMSSCKLYFEEGLGAFGIDERIKVAEGREKRRKIALVLLKSDMGQCLGGGKGKRFALSVRVTFWGMFLCIG